MFLTKMLMVGLLLNPALIKNVIDGDTIDIVAYNNDVRLRLYGIDSPEKKQKYGTESIMCAKSYLLGKTGIVKTYGSDLYGRTLGEVFVNGKNMNINLVSLGCAWATPQYLPASKLGDYVGAQESARKKKLGLWGQNEDPIEPWLWRKLQKNNN